MAKTLEIEDREELWMLKCGLDRFLDRIKDEQEYCVKHYGIEDPTVAKRIEKANNLLQRLDEAFENAPEKIF